MSLIIPSYEERRKMDKTRMEIINSIMQIQNAKHLHILAVMARTYYGECIYDLLLPLNEFVAMLDLPIIVMMDLFKDEDPAYYANKQIKELLSNAIDSYTGAAEYEEEP